LSRRVRCSGPELTSPGNHQFPVDTHGGNQLPLQRGRYFAFGLVRLMMARTLLQPCPNVHVLDTLQQMWYSAVVHRGVPSVRTVLTVHAKTYQRCRPGGSSMLAPRCRQFAGWQMDRTAMRKACSVEEWTTRGRMSTLLPAGLGGQDPETDSGVNGVMGMNNVVLACQYPAPTTWWRHQMQSPWTEPEPVHDHRSWAGLFSLGNQRS
jgi:hypothetical protein